MFTNTVVITGTAGNLGSAVTKEFLNKGYRVVAAAINETEKNAIPANENLEVHIVDVTNETEAADFVKSIINKHSHIHAALMLVGGFATGNIVTTTSSDIEEQFKLNFETAYNISRPLLPHMLQNNNGRLVFIGARPALRATDGKNMVAYALSKSLLFKLAEFINEEAKGKNVTATVVVPSTLDTPLNRKSMPDVDPGIWVAPQQLAEVLEFICSEKATAIREPIFKVYNNA